MKTKQENPFIGALIIGGLITATCANILFIDHLLAAPTPPVEAVFGELSTSEDSSPLLFPSTQAPVPEYYHIDSDEPEIVGALLDQLIMEND